MFGFFDESSNDKMKRKLDEYNWETFDEYMHLVVFLSSDEILKKLNGADLESLVNVNMVIRDVGDALKGKYGFDEVYCFNNEISLIYNFENQKMNEKVMVFNANKNKILTKIASEASCIFTRMMNEKNNYMFKARCVQFSDEEDVDSWKAWRDSDCERNVISYLYKLVSKKDNTNVKKEEMIEELDKYGVLDQHEVKMMLNK